MDDKGRCEKKLERGKFEKKKKCVGSGEGVMKRGGEKRKNHNKIKQKCV